MYGGALAAVVGKVALRNADMTGDGADVDDGSGISLV